MNMNKLLKNSGITVGMLVALVAIFFLVMYFVNKQNDLLGLAVVTGDGTATGASDSPIPIKIFEGSSFLATGTKYRFGITLGAQSPFLPGTLTIVNGGSSFILDTALTSPPAKNTSIRIYYTTP